MHGSLKGYYTSNFLSRPSFGNNPYDNNICYEINRATLSVKRAVTTTAKGGVKLTRGS